MADIDIQGLWEKGKQVSRPAAPEIDIDEAIKGKSKTTLYWIKVILWIEFWVNVVCTPFAIGLFRETRQYGALAFFIVVVIVYLFYYIFLIRSINRFSYLTDVKTNLKRLYKYLNFYLLHYKVLIWTMFPASFIYGFWLGLTSEHDELPDDTKFWVVIIAILVVSTTLMVVLGNWLVNLIYGKKIKRLKGMVQELEETE